MMCHTRSRRALSMEDDPPTKEDEALNKPAASAAAAPSAAGRFTARRASALALLACFFLGGAVLVATATAASASSSSSPSVISLHVLDRIRSRLGFSWGASQPPPSFSAHNHQQQATPSPPPPTTPTASTRIGQGAEESHQYAIVIDGGSTGSRMFVYRFFYPGHGAKREIECISNKKVLPGLSALDGHPEQAGDYMRPLFEHALTIVPTAYQAETLVFIQATAGMRLLSEESAEAIYDHLYLDLTRGGTFPFRLYRRNVGTLSGRLEGFYAALSVNYLTGRIDTHLEREPHEAEEEVELSGETGAPVPLEEEKKEGGRKGPQTQTLVGALDLGGSSTQIVFQHVEDNGAALDQSDFWVQSYLAYGVDTIRYRLWSHLTRHVAPDPGVAGAVENPCAFPGHEEWFKGHRLIGSGDAETCGKEIRRMLWDEEHEKCTPNEPCGLDGVRHPPLTGKFLAMSVFFFALDCMKQLGPFDLPHWPSPSIDEIESAAQRFCAQEWGTLNASADTHAFTRDDLLPYRCVEVVYIHTLLKHGYGFPGDSRNVTFVLDIEGMEVEWTLGFALSEVPLDYLEVEKGTKDTPPHHLPYFDAADEADAKEQAAVEDRRRRQQQGGGSGQRQKAAAAEAAAEARDKEEHEKAPTASQGEPPRENGWQSLNFDLSELHRLTQAWQEQAGVGAWTWWDMGMCVFTTAAASVALALALIFWRGDKEGGMLASPFSSPPTSPKGSASLKSSRVR